MSDKEWIYIKSNDNSYRYALGTKGEQPLFCIGINPSTAEPDALDATLKRVEVIATNNGYDSWVMFNVYPKRDTKFENLCQQANNEEHIKNIETIKQLLSPYDEVDIWVAFGNHIYDRSYLAPCFKDIFKVINNKKANWLATGHNKSGAPKHPLYQKKNSKLFDFDIDEYINTL